jgi:hypothetical protein
MREGILRNGEYEKKKIKSKKPGARASGFFNCRNIGGRFCNQGARPDRFLKPVRS